ncbi:hypothetical protein [Pseudomonas aeruginosa]|uniref:hypothetical protein n=1 Tax=Pseudomonas aeruginosa TaxID=287 RepID=UPI0010F3C5A2|nr:hypothetical protein [Pseudomonas aeruginosa]VTR01520.1 Uncharacterised protein [Pseudomonas aeruginosa]
MSSTQLIEQCATRLRGIVEALDNIHDNTPHRWSTDLDEVHSSAESLLAMIKDQAPPSEDQLIAAGLSYPLAKEDAVQLWYAGFRSEVVTVLEAWEAIGHDIGMNPSKGELLDSLRNMAAICNAHGNDMPAQSAIDQRQAIADAITGALAFGAQASRPPPADHWLRPFYDIGRAEGQRTQELAMLVRMLASSLKRHAPESNLVARATNYLAAKGLAGTPLRDAPASVEQVGGDERAAFELFVRKHCGMPAHIAVNWDAKFTNDAWAGWQARAALAQPSPVRSSLLINGYQLRAALDFIAPDGTAEQLESEACIEWRQQDADFLEAGLYAFCAEYPEKGGVLLDEEPTNSQPSPAQELAERGTQHRFSTTEQTCRHDFAGVWWNDNGVTKTGRECRHCGFFVADAPEVQAEAERPELWAVHAQGPDELYAAFTREDAEKHAAELNALPMPEGIAVGAVVVPSPWPEAEHWKYLAEQEQDHKNEIAGRLRQLERICEGLPQDAIDGGWTAQGIRGYAKRLEDQLKAALAQVEALRAELQSQRERNTELIFKLGSATNGWGRCEKERDAALARVAELERQQPVAWMHDQPNRVDVIHRDVKDLLQRVPGSSRGIHRPLDVSEHYTIPLYAAPVAQAQHSVPEISGIGRDAEHPRAVVLYLRNEPSEEDMRAIQNFLRAISADVLTQAQHSMPKAWLDVQAERRRQVEAEGWTPEHDDEHDSGELAAAGAAYALHAADHLNPYSQGDGGDEAPSCWPWHDGIAGRGEGPEKTEPAWWKPSTPRRDLVKACALALAEIERLDRAAATQGGPSDA